MGSHAVHAKCNVAVSPMTGKVELTFLKMNPPGSGSESQWKSLGLADSELRRTSKRSEAAVFFRTARLSARSRVTYNVELFSFTFASGDVFHVPMGWHVQMKHTLEDGSELKRSYTPVLLDLDHLSAEECPQVARDALTLHFLIKIYAEGPFSLQLDQLKENDEMEISEPIGSFDSKDCQLQTRDLVAIAAGTGITPMIRLIVNALQHGRKVSLLFCNRGSRDVIWNQKFLDLAETYPDKFVAWNVLSEPDEDWTGFRGRISSSILSKTIQLSKCSESDSFVCVCGPNEFTLDTLRLLDDVGYTGDRIHTFFG